jgi:uncharacterized protein (TIGR02145 family)
MIDNLKLKLGVVNSDPTIDTTILEPENTDIPVAIGSVAIDFDWASFNRSGASYDPINNFVTSGELTVSGYGGSDNAWRQVDPSGEIYCIYPTGDAFTITGSLTGCGYLYNWYTASANTGPTSFNNPGDIAPGSICPANWRMPSGYNNTTNDLNNDFPYLNAKMYDNSADTGSVTNNAGYVANWLPTGIFRSVFSGYWIDSLPLSNIGSASFIWSSSMRSNPSIARAFSLTSNGILYVGSNSVPGMLGAAVRCLVGS